MQASRYMVQGSRMLISWSVRKSVEILIPDMKTFNYGITFSMTVLRHIDNERFLPSEEEVPNSSTNNNSKTQPYIVGHED